MGLFSRTHKPDQTADVVLIGAGIMSATLGILIKTLEPTWRIQIYERLDRIAGESSHALNNAGTGHSAFCELNYTPQKEDGTVDIGKALHIAEQFELSKQFWAYMVEQKWIHSPKQFINAIPHLSLVWGEENMAFLKKRFELMQAHPLFKNMEYTEDEVLMNDWIPLIMQNRKPEDQFAATRVNMGTDIDFGKLTQKMLTYLDELDGVDIHLSYEVRDINRTEAGTWELKLKDLVDDETHYCHTPFLFIGAGGASLPLLEKSNIEEAEGYGGFPVSGQWLICKNEKLIEQHHAKVYGKAEIGAPPMSVPHLDTRLIDGKKALLFGPYAGFSTKFLKNGSYMDLFESIELDNIIPMLSAGLHNMPLTHYLIEQVRQSPEERLAALQKFLPDAKPEDWELQEAGQRVQVIKRDKEQGGVLEFGTEIVNSADGSIAALLGASPGASTSLKAMLDVLERCFPEKIKSENWQVTLKRMLPSYGKKLNEDAELCSQVRNWSSAILELNPFTFESNARESIPYLK
jgi:malate dehydrogenase (quinone)